jgi:exodeoxyribonuclease-3
MSTSIVSYNLNGIRSAMSKGLADWIRETQFDLYCFQEIKAQPEQVDVSELEAMGYQHFWHSAEKKGYSGVAVFCKKAPDRVVEGMGLPQYDREGRVIRLDFGDWTIVNAYFPSGTTGDVRQQVKMEFLADFQRWAEALRQERPKLIIVGDYNIAHEEIDIHDPVSNKKSSGFLPEERAWMSTWFASGFHDAFRSLHPGLVEYSWWSFRAGSRARNKGWRIDYQSVSEALRGELIDARQLTEVVHSDHCPVFVRMGI